MDLFKKLNINNKVFITLFVIVFLILGLLYYLFNDNQEHLFQLTNQFNKLDLDSTSSLCVVEDKVVSCEKFVYNNLFGYGKYNLEFNKLGSNISYMIVENELSIMQILFLVVVFSIIAFGFTILLNHVINFVRSYYDDLKYKPVIDEIDKKLDEQKQKEEDLNKRKRDLEESEYISHKIKEQNRKELEKEHQKIQEEKSKLKQEKKDLEEKNKIDYRDIPISFDKNDKKYQESKIKLIEKILDKYNKVSINGNEYVLERGYLVLENPVKKSSLRFLHRRVAKDKLYREKDFRDKNFYDLEVHHIKPDEKLNNFTTNLFVCTREEHKKIHKELLFKFSEESVVREILNSRKNSQRKPKKFKYDDKDSREEKDRFYYGRKRRNN